MRAVGLAQQPRRRCTRAACGTQRTHGWQAARCARARERGIQVVHGATNLGWKMAHIELARQRACARHGGCAHHWRTPQGRRASWPREPRRAPSCLLWLRAAGWEAVLARRLGPWTRCLGGAAAAIGQGTAGAALYDVLAAFGGCGRPLHPWDMPSAAWRGCVAAAPPAAAARAATRHPVVRADAAYARPPRLCGPRAACSATPLTAVLSCVEDVQMCPAAAPGAPGCARRTSKHAPAAVAKEPNTCQPRWLAT
jgi:hypothetical protein